MPWNILSSFVVYIISKLQALITMAQSGRLVMSVLLIGFYVLVFGSILSKTTSPCQPVSIMIIKN